VIAAAEFIAAAVEHGYTLYAGVPCSYLTPLIDRACRAPGTKYIASANEGDALATAAGAVLGGTRAIAFMQNSGLGNAVNPLTSLSWTFRIPVLLMVSLRGEPAHADEPQHRLMGSITERMLELLGVPWEYLPARSAELADALERAGAFMKSEGRPYALVARRGSFAPDEAAEPAFAPTPRAVARRAQPTPLRRPASERPSRRQALQRLVAATPEGSSALIATTGYTGRDLWALADRPNQFYMVGSMGCAAPLALGLSLVRPELAVVVADGDGALLMRMGSVATVGAYAGANLVHIVLDNEAHESTGAQPTVSRGVSFARIAEACGYAHACEGDGLEVLDAVLPLPADVARARGGDDAGARAAGGPYLAQLKTRLGTAADLPRPDVAPERVCDRFRAHIAAIGGQR
jgi:phosphonopyruvate decarboxylase